MIGAAAAYLSGLFFASFFNIGSKAVLFASAVIIIILILKFKGFTLKDFILLTVFFTISATYSFLYTRNVYDRIISYADKNGSFCGEITEITKHDGGFASYIAEGTINNEISAKVSFFTNELDVRYGDEISVEECEFSKIESTYLFDSENWYKSQNIFIKADKLKNISVQKTQSRRIKNFLSSYREKMISAFRISLGEDGGNFLAGMIFGEKRGLDENVKTSLYRSGIGHILAVSGLHVSILAFFIMIILKRIGVGKTISFIILNVFMFFMVVMANSPVSAVRAAVMTDFLYSAGLFRRQNDTFNSLAWSLIIIGAINPYVVYSSGFLLSFSGAFGIGVFAPYITRNMKKNTVSEKIAYSFVTALCTTVCTFPFSMYCFDETSLISPVTNIILVPLCTVSMIIGFVFVLTGGIIPILPLCRIFTGTVFAVSDFLAEINLFHIPKGSGFSAEFLVISAFLTVMVYFIYSERKITVSVLCMLFSVFMLVSSVGKLIRRNRLTAAVLGNNKNSAVIVSYMGNTVIADLDGDYHTADYVEKYLELNGIYRVENLMLIKNVQSQYACYSEKLRYTDILNYTVNGDTFIDEGNNIYLYSGSAEITDGNNFSLKYDSGMIYVKLGETEFCTDSEIFEYPNSELILDLDGKSKIRRLYGTD